jgi:D-alanyl-D-alanine dipeptidase
MAVTGRLDDAEATNWTGEPVVAPGAGELTVTSANALAVAQQSAALRTNQYFPKY